MLGLNPIDSDKQVRIYKIPQSGVGSVVNVSYVQKLQLVEFLNLMFKI
jgi:hypothetical protein